MALNHPRLTKWQSGVTGTVFALGRSKRLKTSRMKNNEIKFVVDRKSAEEGENVLVSWECGLPDAVTLTIDNGFTKSQIQLPDSGSRTVAIQRSKGSTTLRLTVAQSGRIERREIAVKVKNIKRVKAKTYRARPQGGGGSIRSFFQRIGYKLRGWMGRMGYAWRAMPLKRRRIYLALLIWAAAMMLSTCSHNNGYKAGYQRALQEMSATSSAKAL